MTLHSGAVTAAFTANQGSTTIQPNGVAMIGSPVTLTFTGQVATPNTGTCYVGA